jgi:anti-sigma B factor antagonist
MKQRTRFVSIGRLPLELNRAKNQSSYHDLERCINVNRPAVVLDCSMVQVFDRPVLHLLLCCLEEAMKRNGDIRLAALSPEAQSVLESTGVDRLFHCFETVDEAVESYGRPQVEFASIEEALTARQSEMNAA